MSELPLVTILSSMVEGVIAVDRACVVQFINPAAQALFRIAVPATTRQPLLTVVRQAELHQLLQRVLASGTPETCELSVFGPSERVLRAQAVAYQDETGAGGAVVVLSDLTEMRRLERLRRDFVANVSHELRTPVTAIQTAVETLQAGAAEQPDTRAKFIDKIAAQSLRLARLIDDLIALSQVESGGIPFRFEPVALEPVFREAASTLQAQADRQHVTVRLQLPAELPTVRGDRDRLQQIAVNLLDNAIKFNRPGGTVTVGAAADERTVTVTVADTGIGIPSEDVPRIFERFYRVDKDRARATGGTGLGLAIVKHLVEAHAGAIRADSAPDRGSTFHVTLPLAA